MRREGIKPDIFTAPSITHACSLDGSLKNGKDIHGFIMENDLQLNFSVSNAHIHVCKMWKHGRCDNSFFSHGQEGYCLMECPNRMFIEMQNESKLDNITMTCFLPVCASLSALKKGRQVHGWILRSDFFPDIYVANALADMYVKFGVLVLAHALFYKILKKDLISWTIMIAGYGMHGLGKEAIAAFTEMRNSGFEPNEVVFISILNACSHSGLAEEGLRFFNIMRYELKIEPMMEHFACIVDLFSRAGKLSEAYIFIKKMTIKANTDIWGALLSGCRINHDVKLAEKVAEHVFELEPENTVYYVLLANIYAEAEKWEEVKKMRAKIHRRALKPNAGCSWIEVNGRVNIFVTGGDSFSHPQANKIDILLKKLSMKMKEEGYFVKTRHALINADVKEKEMASCGQSEKLAMAFGILSLPSGRIVRVSKNERVCGECHEMAKFMSKTCRGQLC